MNPNEAIRDARSLGLPKMLILGVQHMFAMFGATILVPILVQGYGLPLNIQTTLFFAGVGTLFFHLCTKMQVPAFLGSSFAFLGGYMSMAGMNEGIYAGMTAEDKLAYTCGGIVVAGLLYLVLAAVIKVVGVRKVMRFLPPVVTGPIIICIGLTLAPSAVTNAATCWPLAVIALATIVIFNVWGKGMFKIIPILMGVVVSYVAALIMNACGMNVIDFTAVREADLLGLPPFLMAHITRRRADEPGYREFLHIFRHIDPDQVGFIVIIHRIQIPYDVIAAVQCVLDHIHQGIIFMQCIQIYGAGDFPFSVAVVRSEILTAIFRPYDIPAGFAVGRFAVMVDRGHLIERHQCITDFLYLGRCRIPV